MTRIHTDITQKIPLQCSYDTTYYSMYQPSYNMMFIFCDEEEEYEESNWSNSITPASHGSRIQH